MRTVTGQLYGVAFTLSTSAALLGPTWLVGALASSYPGSDVAGIERYGSGVAVVIMRWRVSGTINVGDVVTPSVQGLQIPGEALPVATVTDVGETHVHPEQLLSRSVAALPEEGRAVLKLGAAGALILVVWYFSRRIERAADARSASAESRAA